MCCGQAPQQGVAELIQKEQGSNKNHNHNNCVSGIGGIAATTTCTPQGWSPVDPLFLLSATSWPIGSLSKGVAMICSSTTLRRSQGTCTSIKNLQVGTFGNQRLAQWPQLREQLLRWHQCHQQRTPSCIHLGFGQGQKRARLWIERQWRDGVRVFFSSHWLIVLAFSVFGGGGTSFDNELISIIICSLCRLNNKCDNNGAMYWEQGCQPLWNKVPIVTVGCLVCLEAPSWPQPKVPG